MEVFNNKVLMTTDLYPPQFSFDADNWTLKFELKDKRDFSKIEYTLNRNTYNVEPFRMMSYKDDSVIIEYDKLYYLTYTVKPVNSKYKTIIKTVPIFYNHPYCKFFRYGNDYGTDDKLSKYIYAYKGESDTVIVPDIHNRKETISAVLNEFPYIVSNEINIKTGRYLYLLNLIKDDEKDQRIKTISMYSLLPTTDQFSYLSNLERVTLTTPLSSLSTRMFKNCPKVQLNPSITKNIGTFGNFTEVFVNTPSLRSLLTSLSYIPSSQFDYTSDYIGYPKYQKAIFTRQETINDFDQVTLLTQDTEYTAGMKYVNPETGLEENHQVFCRVDEAWWPVDDALPANDKVEILSVNNSGSYANNYLFTFKVYDRNIVGIKILVVSGSTGKLKGARMWIPERVRPGSGYQDYRTETQFYLSESRLYFGSGNKFTVGTTPGSLEATGGFTIDPAGKPMSTDRFYLTPITTQGLSENTYAYTLAGSEVDPDEVPPQEGITKIIYTERKSGSYTITINGREIYISSSAPTYTLYFTRDDYEHSPKVLRFHIENKNGEPISGTSKTIVSEEYYDGTSNGRKIYSVNLSRDPFNYDPDMLKGSTDYKLKVSYDGYAQTTYGTSEITFYQKLTGTLN